MRLRSSFLLSFLFACGMIFVYFVNWISKDLEPRYRESVEDSLVETSALAAAFITATSPGGKIEPGPFVSAAADVLKHPARAQIYGFEKASFDVRFYVTDERGIVLWASDPALIGSDYSQWNDVVRTLRGEYGARTTRDNPDDATTTVLYVASPVILKERLAGVVTVGKPVRQLKAITARAKGRLIGGAFVTAAVSTIMLILLSVWVTTPLRRLTDYARAVRDGRRTGLPKLGGGEIGELGAAFEEMRLVVEGRKYVERYVETLTHELKSPLTAIRGAAEILAEDPAAPARERFVSNILSETERIRKVIDRLLQLTALEGLNALETVESIAVSEAVESAVLEIRSLAEASGVKLDLHLEPLVIRGQAELVKLAVSNLLTNALRVSPEGSPIEVRLTKEGAMARIEVRDYGPGIPDFAVERIFERFYSLNDPKERKKGSGLGLSIVREICALHGGTVTVANAAGGGVQAVMKLPLAEVSPKY